MREPLHQFMRTNMVHIMMFHLCLHGAGPMLETLTTLATDPYFDAIEVVPINDPVVRASCVSLLQRAQVTPLFVGQA